MKLTGKAKEAFERYVGYAYIIDGYIPSLEYFYKLPDSFKFGVIVDWADSVGYFLEVIIDGLGQFGFQIFGRGKSKPLESIGGYTRPEARTAAVENLDELFNNQN